MAKRLGVSTPAVNKWENGNSNPDIELLAPIARLLHISLDTLMSFHEELSPSEIDAITEKRVLDEIQHGEQTIQYQINTLQTTNGFFESYGS